MAGMDYLESGDTQATAPATSAGNNPSTWSGTIVLVALVALFATRKSFRRFM